MVYSERNLRKDRFLKHILSEVTELRRLKDTPDDVERELARLEQLINNDSQSPEYLSILLNFSNIRNNMMKSNVQYPSYYLSMIKSLEFDLGIFVNVFLNDYIIRLNKWKNSDELYRKNIEIEIYDVDARELILAERKALGRSLFPIFMKNILAASALFAIVSSIASAGQIADRLLEFAASLLGAMQ